MWRTSIGGKFNSIPFLFERICCLMMEPTSGICTFIYSVISPIFLSHFPRLFYTQPGYSFHILPNLAEY